MRCNAEFPPGQHVRAALDQRFQSRIIDRQRALGGRLTASLHHAASLNAVTDAIATTGGEPLARVLEREQLARLTSAIGQLTLDQRLVLCSQLDGRERPAQFCARHGWK